jgi:subtilisin family serine protease
MHFLAKDKIIIIFFFFFIFIFPVYYHCIEPVLFVHNHTSSLDSTHRIQKTISEKYSTKDIVAVRVKDCLKKSNTDIDIIAKSHGFYNKETIGSLPCYYLWEREKLFPKEPTLFARLNESEHIEWWDVMKPRERFKRSMGISSSSSISNSNNYLDRKQDPNYYNREDIRNFIYPTDPLYDRQWHHTEEHLNSIGAWKNHAATGFGVNVAVVDDGCQFTHPDLSWNFDRQLSWDFNEDDDDPSPSMNDGHGTCASGVVAASKDNHCGVGVAYDSKLACLRLLGSWTSDSDEAKALCHRCDESNYSHSIHVYSNSWGPSDDGEYLTDTGHLVKQAFQYCTENGRGGKGSVYVWAGGNGRYNGDNSNYDGYANSIYTITVSAADNNGIYTWYSEPGANILCAAPSSGNGDKSIVTTDLLSRFGYSNGACTFDFGGTSAAAPQIAGVVSLMLEVRPELSWRDVQHILILSCKITDTHNTQWTENAAGFKHSYDYGFGLVDAETAAVLSYSWNLLSTNQPYYMTSGDQIPKNDGVHSNTKTISFSPFSNSQETMISTRGVATKEFYWSVPTNNNPVVHIRKLNYVVVHVEMETKNSLKCLKLELIGPSGVSSILHAGNAVNAKQSTLNWDFMTIRHWGEEIIYVPVSVNNKDTIVYEDDKEYQEEKKTSMRPIREWTLRVYDLCTNGNILSSSSSSSSSNYLQNPKKIGQFTLKKWRLDFYGD